MKLFCATNGNQIEGQWLHCATPVSSSRSLTEQTQCRALYLTLPDLLLPAPTLTELAYLFYVLAIFRGTKQLTLKPSHLDDTLSTQLREIPHDPNAPNPANALPDVF
jgi:hypothetical protein